MLDGIADVALRATADDLPSATKLSKAKWDQARQSQGRTDLPSADAIRKRLKLDWDRAMALGLADASRRRTLLGQWDGSHWAGWGETGPELALATLRAIALRLGGIPTPFEYDQQVQAIEADGQRRRSSRPQLLPSSSYLLKRYESWSEALQASGLETRPATAPQPPPHEAPALAVSLDRFIEGSGILPTSAYLLEWCRRMDIPTPRVKAWPVVVAAVRDMRAARGVATPLQATATKDCPPLPLPVPRQRRKPFRHSREDIISSLCRYGSLHLASGKLPGQKDYMAACRQDPTLIWPGRFTRFGRFHDLCREAGIE